MRSRFLFVLGLPALLAITPVPGHASSPIWIQGVVGGASYKMGDVNANVAEINRQITPMGYVLDQLTDGVTYGGAIGFDIGHGFALGLAYDRLEGRTEFGDSFAALSFDLPADVYRVFGRYTIGSALTTQEFVEASAGRISPAGSLSYRETGQVPFRGDLGSSGLALEGSGGVQRWFAPWLAVNGAIGYRYAVVEHTLVGLASLQDVTGGEYQLDYSGFFFRGGLTVVVSH